VAGHGDSNAIRTRRLRPRVYVVGDGESAAQPGQGLMAPRVGIAAHHQANQVIRLLLGVEEER
jgi:sulfur carrier protein ThiS adenylyltransferase